MLLHHLLKSTIAQFPLIDWLRQAGNIVTGSVWPGDRDLDLRHRRRQCHTVGINLDLGSVALVVGKIVTDRLLIVRNKPDPQCRSHRQARCFGTDPLGIRQIVDRLRGTQTVDTVLPVPTKKVVAGDVLTDAAPTALVQVLTDPSEGSPDAPPSSSPSYEVTLALNWITLSGAQ